MFETARYKPFPGPVMRSDLISEEILQPEETQRQRPPVLLEGSHIITYARLSLRPGSGCVGLAPCDRCTTVHAGHCNANQDAFGMVVLEGSQAQGYHGDTGAMLRIVEAPQQAAQEQD